MFKRAVYEFHTDEQEDCEQMQKLLEAVGECEAIETTVVDGPVTDVVLEYCVEKIPESVQAVLDTMGFFLEGLMVKDEQNS